MSLWGKVKSGLATRSINFLAANGRTEGWETSLDRRRPGTALTSTDTEYNFGNRERMMSEARSLCQTFGIASSILGKFANYCVGSCEVDFDSGDPAWDELAEATARRQFEIIDVSGEHNLASMAKLGVRSKKRDGDIGFLKTKENGWPQLQAIEGDRIRSQPFLFNNDLEKGFIGGVHVDRTGRPQLFRVWERQLINTVGGFENPREIPAEAFQFWKEKKRFDGVRGITAFESGALNRLRDVKEILQAESKAIKAHGKIALLIKRAMGGQPASGVNIFARKDGSGTNLASEEIPDGLIKYLLPNEDAQAFQSNRPSPTFTGFLDFLIRDIAVSLELPVSFVWALLGLTGPGVRLESKQAEKTFKAEIEDMERSFLNPICAWVISWAMLEAKVLPFHPNWHRFEFSRPSHPSIDVGRESKADLDELDACITSPQTLAAERGNNSYKELRKKAKFIKAAMGVSALTGVPLEMLIVPRKNAPPQDQQHQEAA